MYAFFIDKMAFLLKNKNCAITEKLMKTYWVIVKLSRATGSGTTKASIQAENPHAAYSLFKAMYGDLLVSQFANPE